jgi:hypothetical protein
MMSERRAAAEDARMGEWRKRRTLDRIDSTAEALLHFAETQP